MQLAQMRSADDVAVLGQQWLRQYERERRVEHAVQDDSHGRSGICGQQPRDDDVGVNDDWRSSHLTWRTDRAFDTASRAMTMA